MIFPDLPPAAHEGNLWYKCFVPTLVKYLGFSEYLWYWNGDYAVRFTQEIWSVVYGERVPWTVRPQDLVHAKVRSTLDRYSLLFDDLK